MKRSTVAIGATGAVAAAVTLYYCYKRQQGAAANDGDGDDNVPASGPSPRVLSEAGTYPLGPAEQALAGMSIHNGMFRVALRLRLSGEPVELPILRAALARLQARHPILRCTFDVQEDSPPAATDAKTEDATATGPVTPPRISLKENSDVSIPIIELSSALNTGESLDTTWTESWHKLQHAPFELGSPVMSIVLIRSATQCMERSVVPLTELGVIIEHGVSDGISACQLAHELLLQLALLSSDEPAPPVETLPFVATMEETVAAGAGARAGAAATAGTPPSATSDSSSPSSLVASIWSRGRALLGLPAPAPTTTTPALPTPPPPTHNFLPLIPHADRDTDVITHIFYGHLSKEDTRALIANCRARKITVTSAVVAAEAAATAELMLAHRPPKPEEAPEDGSKASEEGDEAPSDSGVSVQVSLAVDTRKLYQPEKLGPEHLGFHVAGMRPVAKGFSDASITTEQLWDHATEVRQSIVDGMGEVLGFVPFMGPALAGAASPPPPEAPPAGPSISLSSWGKLPFVDTYGKYTLVHALPTVNCSNPAPFPSTLCSTANDTLTMTFMTGAVFDLDKVMRPLRDGVVRHLRAMATSPAPPAPPAPSADAVDTAAATATAVAPAPATPISSDDA